MRLSAILEAAVAHRSIGQERLGFAAEARSASSLDDRASFRRFCGFSGTEATPERTAFVRFRKALITQGLDRLLFETVTAQLKAKAITVKTGILVDATIIASASKGDDDARWVKHVDQHRSGTPLAVVAKF